MPFNLRLIVGSGSASARRRASDARRRQSWASSIPAQPPQERGPRGIAYSGAAMTGVRRPGLAGDDSVNMRSERRRADEASGKPCLSQNRTAHPDRIFRPVTHVTGRSPFQRECRAELAARRGHSQGSRGQEKKMHQALTAASGSTGSFYLLQERPFGGPLPTSSAGEDRQQTHAHVHIHASRPEWRVSYPTDVDRRDLGHWS